MITKVKYTDLTSTQVKITLDDGREMFAGVEGSTWLHAELNEWIKTRDIEPPTAPSLHDTKTAKLHRINAAKNTYLDGGFLHNGALFDSDSKARLAYLEFAHKLTSQPTYSTPWKASSGQWVTMDAALFSAIQPIYEQHISACFAWQAAREQEIEAATTIEAVNAISESM